MSFIFHRRKANQTSWREYFYSQPTKSQNKQSSSPFTKSWAVYSVHLLRMLFISALIMFYFWNFNSPSFFKVRSCWLPNVVVNRVMIMRVRPRGCCASMWVSSICMFMILKLIILKSQDVSIWPSSQKPLLTVQIRGPFTTPNSFPEMAIGIREVDERALCKF